MVSLAQFRFLNWQTAYSKNDIVPSSVVVLPVESFEDFVEAVQICKTFTFIFYVEIGGTLNQAQGIQAVRSLSKLLAQYCKCIQSFRRRMP